MPSAFEIIRQELPKFLEEPHAQDFVDFTSSLVPTTAEDVGLELAMGPFGKAARLGGAAIAGLGYSPEAEASPLARGLIKSGGALKNWLDEAIEHALRRRTHDAGEVERIERIAKELPVVPSVYSPQALAERAVFARPGELVELTPRRFRRLAEPLEGEYLTHAIPYLEHYKDLIKAGEWVEPPKGLFAEQYLQRQRQVPFKGFSDIPYLLTKHGQVIGHEGRHRNMAIADLFGLDEPSIVDIRGSTGRSKLYPESDVMQELPMRLEYSGGEPFKRYAGGGLARYADGGRTRVPKDLLNREEQELQARQILEGLRGFAGSPYRESVMVPGAAEARESGELASILGEAADLAPGVGALKGLGGLALAGAIRRGGNPMLLATHNLSGDPWEIADLIRNRRSISSPSVAISREVNPFQESPTLLFNPESPMLDPAVARANQLLARDAYTFRQRQAPNIYRLGGEDVRFSEGHIPGAGKRFAIEMSPRFKSFAEYERSPYGAGILGKFTQSDKDIANELAKARNDWVAKNMGRIQSGEFGENRSVKQILLNAAKSGDPEVRAFIEGARKLPSRYAELKVVGELPIGPRDVSAIMLPETFDDIYDISAKEFIESVQGSGIPVGTPSMLMPSDIKSGYNAFVSAAAKNYPEMARTARTPEGRAQFMRKYGTGLPIDALERFIPYPINQISDPNILRERIRNTVYKSPAFASDVARRLTRYADGGSVNEESGITQTAMLNRLISAYNEL